MASESEQNRPVKKPNHGEEEQLEEDFISCLPDTILHIILSKLEMRDAAVTTAVSKRWAPLFNTLPSLKIDADSFNPRDPNSHLEEHGEPYVKNPDKWIDAFYSVLDARKASVKKFDIDVEILDWYHEYFDEVIRELCDNGVEELLIYNTEIRELYRIPSPVFSCNTVVKLDFSHCRLVVPSKLTGLRSVKSLKLYCVTVADIDLRRMISRCKAMEKLVITECNKVEDIVIRGPSLVKLEISSYRPFAISLKSVPRLTFVKVSFSYDYEFWRDCYASFEERNAGHLSDECFSPSDSEKSFEGANEATKLMAFLNRLRIVKDLRLDFSDECCLMLSKEGIALPPKLSPKCYLVELKKLCLSWPSNYHTFNTIVSCLLNSSPHLMEVMICVNTSTYDHEYHPVALELDFWDKQLPAECVKHHVTAATFLLDGYISEYCFGFPKFLLLNARTLKNMNIFYTGNLKGKPETAEKIKNQLLGVQMASSDSEITIKPILSKYRYIEDF
ncbi:F-box family protein [Rhynchospora pubera]|uniref:F-box family protein n=1 Tax=Rhynchospora pubera TaxID=906938 RepID=A0AAV8EKL7_9POAL|nr:F-box family protein [Rhynchospora pubera]